MAQTVGSLRRLFARPEGLMIAVLTAAAIALAAAAVIGARGAVVATAAYEPDGAGTATDLVDYGDLDGPAVDPSVTAGPETAGPAAGGEAAEEEAADETAAVESPVQRASTEGATREGVFADHFKIGIHAPITFDGVPLPLAEDPITGLKGYITYVNRQGGVNGLKARIEIHDDRYTTQGGQQAADRIVKEMKPFIIEGTLGIDQIAKVAAAAGKASIPYFAAGGPEPEFKEMKMYQIAANYDQYLDMVTDFICKYGPAYVGGSKANDVRLATSTLNSAHILPVEKRFVEKVSQRKCVSLPVDSRARRTINKPTEQTTYGGQMLDYRTAYANQGANLVIPLQDPITTTRQVLEWSKSGYRPKWTIANFAHDSDTALTLFQGEWAGMRVMSGGCYYHPSGGGDPYNEGKCAKLGEAHKQWVGLGPVNYDQNAGGSAGGRGSYTYDESSWEEDGGGGVAGYQLVYFWHGAMKAIGTDPTRERFVAALNAYDNYSNLVTSPITFSGSPNTMIGATKFVLLEGQTNRKWRQVTEITPGLVDHF